MVGQPSGFGGGAMPLKERTIVDLREEIARLILKGHSVTEVGQHLGVSRPTVRLWRSRVSGGGARGVGELFACEGLRSTWLELAWPVIERVFLEHGSPRAMQSDNGPPFGAPGRGRISTLSVRLMKHGIQPIFVHPGRPQENGAHERMHRTLKAATTRPAAYDFKSQQKKFDQFRHDFNVERPHEGIEMQRPAVVYQPIRRAYSRKIKPAEYDSGFEVRRVSPAGTISWHNRHIYVGEALRQERIALEPTEGRTQTLHFYGFTIGKLNEETGTID